MLSTYPVTGGYSKDPVLIANDFKFFDRFQQEKKESYKKKLEEIVRFLK